MRTRILNKMTNAEVEAYLQRNDVIFVPVGTVETHGVFGVDAETVIPEAIAQRLAEKADGIALSGLPYFFCGATTEARSSVQMSVSAGVEYLRELAVSLLKQGFRRQVWIGGHAPGFLQLGTLVNDLFHETGAPISYLAGAGMPKPQSTGGAAPAHSWVKGINLLTLGAYTVLGRLDEVLIDPEVAFEDSFEANILPDDEVSSYSYLFHFGPLSGQVGFYQNRPQCHFTFYGAARSQQELLKYSEIGRQMLEEGVGDFDIRGYLEELRALDRQACEARLAVNHLSTSLWQ